MSLAQKSLSGYIYTFGSKIITKLITFAGGIFVARLLDPKDYGLIGMLLIIFSISNFMISGGMGLALIREKEITEKDKATVFFFNTGISLVLYILIWFSAPYVSMFYDEPQLVLLARVMGLDIIFKSFTIVQNSVFKRELKFKELGVIGIISGIVTIIPTLLLAYNNYGVLSLAVRFILGSLIGSILLYAINPWLPKYFFDKNSFKKLFAFGSNVMLLGFVNNISKEIHKVVIGKYFSTSSLGFFKQGQDFKDTVSNTLNDTVMSVSFPILSKLQDDKERLKRGYMRIMRMNSYVIFPSITLLILTAEPFIIGLLGVKWSGAVVFLQVLGLTGYVRHLHSINLNVLKVYGKGKDYLAQGIIRNGLTIIGVVIAVNISVEAMAWSLVITEFLQLFVNVYYSNKYIKFNMVEQFKVMLPIIVLNLFMAVFIFVLADWIPYTHLIKLPILLFCGLIFYISFSMVFKLNAFIELKKLLLERIKK